MNVQLFLCRIAGISAKAYRLAPNGRTVPSLVGLGIVLTTTFAFCNATYAFTRVFLCSRYTALLASLFGLLWASLVFTLDRLLVATFSPDIRVRAAQIVLRIALGSIIAFSMSMPTLLRIARPMLDEHIREARINKTTTEKETNRREAHLGELESLETSLDGDVVKQRNRLVAEPDSFAYRSAKSTSEAAKGRLAATNERLRPLLEQVRLELLGERDPERILILQDRQRELRAESRRAATEAELAAKEVERAAQRWYRDEQQILERLQHDQHETRIDTSRVRDQVNTRNGTARTELTSLMSYDLAREFAAYREVVGDKSNPNSAALKTIANGLHILFWLIEMTPVLLKLMSPNGSMAAAVRATEAEEIEAINNGANLRISQLQKKGAAAQEILDAEEDRRKTEYLKNVKSGALNLAKFKEDYGFGMA